MTSSSPVPAQLGFFAIYNPSLANSDQDYPEDQIVYYASLNATPHKSPRRQTSNKYRNAAVLRSTSTDPAARAERNEQLRQVGLARGMVELSRGFAGGNAVDWIETEKSRILLHELESGWWMLASIDLSRVPLPPKLPTGGNPSNTAGGGGGGPNGGNTDDENVEYTSRELKPAVLVLQDLLRAHSIFLLHHDASLSALFVRSRRSKFAAVLGRYWDIFLSTWSVTLSRGNPARDVFGTINLAASGELGIGVGEEDRGSAEREVLEGLVGRVEGLVDVVVSRFGDEASKHDADGADKDTPPSPWIGTGRPPSADDGAIFLGTGALSKKSLRDITHWMEDLYTWGDNAYGVLESPTSMRLARRPKKPVSSKPRRTEATPDVQAQTAAVATLTELNRKMRKDSDAANSEIRSTNSRGTGEETSSIMDGSHDGDKPVGKLVNYLKFGYGTYWTLGQSGANSQASSPNPGSKSSSIRTDAQKRQQQQLMALTLSTLDATKEEPITTTAATNNDDTGRFLIGFLGDIEEPSINESGNMGSGQESGAESEDTCSSTNSNSRTMLRTIHIELEGPDHGKNRPEGERVQNFMVPLQAKAGFSGGAIAAAVFSNDDDHGHGHDPNKASKLRTVVYVSRPFIFTLVFRLRTDSLAWEGFYRSLHHQISPLRRPLLESTAYRPPREDIVAATADSILGSKDIITSGVGFGWGSSAASPEHIYDLVWDSRANTVRCCIPDIPPAGRRGGSGSGTTPMSPWSRAEAVNTHMQILALLSATHDRPGEMERLCKTSRGWWIVWNRIRDAEDEENEDERDKEKSDGNDNNDNDHKAKNQKEPHTDTPAPHKPDDSPHLSAPEPASKPNPSRPPLPAFSRHPSHISCTPSARARGDLPQGKEILLIRRASDHAGFRGVVSASLADVGLGGIADVGSSSTANTNSNAGGAGDGVTRLAQGIGIDTRKYIDALLSLA